MSDIEGKRIPDDLKKDLQRIFHAEAKETLPPKVTSEADKKRARAQEIIDMVYDVHYASGKNVSFRGNEGEGGLILTNQDEIPDHIEPLNGQVIDLEDTLQNGNPVLIIPSEDLLDGYSNRF